MRTNRGLRHFQNVETANEGVPGGGGGSVIVGELGSLFFARRSVIARESLLEN